MKAFAKYTVTLFVADFVQDDEVHELIDALNDSEIAEVIRKAAADETMMAPIGDVNAARYIHVIVTDG